MIKQFLVITTLFILAFTGCSTSKDNTNNEEQNSEDSKSDKENIGDSDNSIIPDNDSHTQDSSTTPDSDLVKPIPDEDSAPAAVCGNNTVENGEICEKEETKNCTEINASYESGTASCSDDCLNWKTTNCVRKPPEVLCTGQSKCYGSYNEITCPSLEESDWYGQDPQYSDLCTPKNYTGNSETVTDNNTGLLWQWKPTSNPLSEGSLSLQEAIDYCENLTLEGISTWRLPNIEEIETLIDYGISANRNPKSFLFLPPGAEGLLSSSPYSEDSVWIVKYTGEVESNWSSSWVFRCVSGNEYKPVADFVDEWRYNEYSRIVTDLRTKLQWSTRYRKNLSWWGALKYCKDLDFGGHTDWRLPNINELKTLLNRAKSNPASDFPEIYPERYWSSSSELLNGGGWFVNFFDGTSANNGGVYDNYFSKNNEFYVMCVR